MKKSITCLLLTVILLIAFACPVFAVTVVDENGPDEWVLAPDAAYVTYGDATYLPMDFPFSYYYAYTAEWHEGYELTFADKQTEKKYGGSEIWATEGAKEIAIEVTLYRRGEWYKSVLYVEESHVDDFQQVKDGNPDSYVVDNFYGSDLYTISPDAYALWRNGPHVEMPARELEAYDWNFIYGCDPTRVLMYEYGVVLREPETDALYLLRYSDYDRSYFYSGGAFATDHDGMVTLYVLEDETLRQALVTFYDTAPDDELDWLITDQQSRTVTGVVMTIFFGMIPLAVIGGSALVLIKAKERAYRLPLILVMVGAAMVLIAFVVVFLHLAAVSMT